MPSLPTKAFSKVDFALFQSHDACPRNWVSPLVEVTVKNCFKHE